MGVCAFCHIYKALASVMLHCNIFYSKGWGMRFSDLGRLVTVAAFAAIAGTHGVAAGEAVSGKKLVSAVSGKVVSVSTPVGAVPVKYHSNGTMSASSGGIAKLTGMASDKGKWWVSGSKLCQRWSNWLEGKTHCLLVKIDGSKVRWTSTSGKSGLATISN